MFLCAYRHTQNQLSNCGVSPFFANFAKICSGDTIIPCIVQSVLSSLMKKLECYAVRDADRKLAKLE